uniref:SFRICE_030641 n=1 Tax=Spodoptera frugiperda TaxID=7108 RepID=A0A2H1VT48_SPOFR
MAAFIYMVFSLPRWSSGRKCDCRTRGLGRYPGRANSACGPNSPMAHPRTTKKPREPKLYGPKLDNVLTRTFSVSNDLQLLWLFAVLLSKLFNYNRGFVEQNQNAK